MRHDKFEIKINIGIADQNFGMGQDLLDQVPGTEELKPKYKMEFR